MRVYTYLTGSISRLNRMQLICCILVMLSICFYSCNYFSTKTQDHPAFFDKVINKATKIREAGNPDLCIHYLDSVYAKFPNPGVGDLFRKYDLIRYCYYADKKDKNKAMVYADSMLYVLEGYTDKKEYFWSYAFANFSKGDIYFDQRKYNDAYQSIYKGKTLAEKVLDPCAMMDYDSRLAMICYKQNNYQNAIVYFKKAIKDLRTCKKDFVYAFEQQRLMDNIGLSFNKLNIPDSAQVYYTSGLDLIKREEPNYKEKYNLFEMAKGVIYGNLAEVLIGQTKMDSAEVLLNKSISINIKKGFDNRDAIFSKLKLADLYIETNKLNKSEVLLKQIRISLDSLPQDEAELRWRKVKWKYLDKSQQFNEAYVQLQSYIALRDSIKQANIGLMNTKIDEELDNFEREHQLLLFKKASEIKRAYLIMGFGLFIIIILILYFTWRNWKRTQRNLTEMARLNKQIHFQNLQLEVTIHDLIQSNKDKDRIMKVLAHDLNNPIGAIANISDLLLMEEDINPEHKELLKLIKISSTNCIEMINDLVEALLNTTQSEVKKELTDLNILIKESVNLLRFKADEKDQIILIDCEEKVNININREKIMRVLINLIANAIKFSPFGETIKISLEKQLASVLISVGDHGIGIPPEMEDTIFNMFTNAQRIGTNGEQSFGLGLSISKKIVESHMGTIGFKRNEEKGTIFYFELPL